MRVRHGGGLERERKVKWYPNLGDPTYSLTEALGHLTSAYLVNTTPEFFGCVLSGREKSWPF
jgi:hypothetical protein